jgi:hypothetical protein
MAGEVMKLGLGIMPLVQRTLGNGNGANGKPKSEPGEDAEPKT